MRVPVLVFCAVSLAAQTLPSTWAGGGAAYSPGGSPKVAGWASIATLVAKTQQVYSFTSVDITPLAGHFSPTQMSLRTGVATPLRTFGPLTILGLADAGLASTGTATSGAYSGGGIAVWRLANNWTVEAGARLVKSGSATIVVWEVGPGRVWQ